MPKIADYYAEMKKVIFLFSALIICTALFGAQYQITFYKISAELKGEVTPELVKTMFVSDANTNCLRNHIRFGYIGQRDKFHANKFPEKYDDNLNRAISRHTTWVLFQNLP